MAECTKCNSSIKGESGIRCNGVCNNVYHYTKNVPGLNNTLKNYGREQFR